LTLSASLAGRLGDSKKSPDVTGFGSTKHHDFGSAFGDYFMFFF